MACQPYFIVLIVRTRDVRTMTKLEWLVNRILSFSQSVHATYETMTKLEWLVNRILSFSQSVHVTYETMTDFSQYGPRSGSSQLGLARLTIEEHHRNQPNKSKLGLYKPQLHF